jgi:hypothetical protein
LNRAQESAGVAEGAFPQLFAALFMQRDLTGLSGGVGSNRSALFLGRELKARNFGQMAKCRRRPASGVRLGSVNLAL